MPFISWFVIVACIIALKICADHLVVGAGALSLRAGISKLMTGLFVIGAATSAPELSASVVAALGGSSDMAAGNVIGSNIANLALILGIGAILSPLVVSGNIIKRDCGFLVASSLAAVILCLMPLPVIGLACGICGFAAIIIYGFYVYHGEKNSHLNEAVTDLVGVMSLRQAIVRVIFSVTGLVIAASFFVDHAQIVAKSLGFSDAFAGLVIAAIGTSLPELASTIAGVRKGETELVLGNIIGSSIFNLLGIGAITALVAPISVSPEIALIDTPIMLLLCLIVWGFVYTKNTVGRIEGMILLAFYAGFLWLQMAPATKNEAIAYVQHSVLSR